MVNALHYITVEHQLAGVPGKARRADGGNVECSGVMSIANDGGAKNQGPFLQLIPTRRLGWQRKKYKCQCVF